MIIGVDNGLNGGLVAISKQTGAVIDKTVMPTLHRCKKRETDTRKVYEWVMALESDFIFAIEDHYTMQKAHKLLGLWQYRLANY